MGQSSDILRVSEFAGQKAKTPESVADLGFSRQWIGGSSRQSSGHGRILVVALPLRCCTSTLAQSMAGSRLASVYRRRYSGKPSQSASERLRPEPREGRHRGVNPAAACSLWGAWFPSDRPMPDGVQSGDSVPSGPAGPLGSGCPFRSLPQPSGIFEFRGNFAIEEGGGAVGWVTGVLASYPRL